tara:strand:- start:3163 stop:3723 length:561 start_codon:yes stop_codon:yes gene_type:complete
MSNVPKSISESPLMKRGLPFSDYDNESTFRWIESMLREDGFQDSSYGNNVCPSLAFGYYETGHTSVQVFIDYKRKSRREIADAKVFRVITTSDEDAELNKIHAVTDDAQLAISMAVSAALALREWHETRTAEYRGADYGDDDEPATPEPDLYFSASKPTSSVIDQLEKTISDVARQVDLLVAGGDR